jgi:hypothetical protein
MIEYLERFEIITYPRVKPNTYKIGDCGTVINIKSNNELSYKVDKDGYLTVGLYTDDGNRTTFSIHRLVAWQFCEGYDEINGRTHVNHKDCDTSYPFYGNLEWCTPSENVIYALKYGNRTGIKGEDSNLAKYKESQIRRACELAEQGYDRKYISEETGINKSYLTDLFNKKKWVHVTSQYNLPPTRVVSFKGYPMEVQLEIIFLIKQGFQPKRICEILGLEYNTTNKTAITNLRKKAYK